MTDQTPVPEPQQPPAQQDPASGLPPASGGQQTPPPEPQQPPAVAVDIESHPLVQQLKQEAGARRIAAKKAQDELAAALARAEEQDARLAELATEIDQWQSRAKQSAFIALAAEVGVPSEYTALLDIGKFDLDTDAGRAAAAEMLKPLARQPLPSGGRASNTSPGGGMSVDQWSKLDPDERLARYDEVFNLPRKRP